jgi:hypothetical protein
MLFATLSGYEHSPFLIPVIVIIIAALLFISFVKGSNKWAWFWLIGSILLLIWCVNSVVLGVRSINKVDAGFFAVLMIAAGVCFGALAVFGIINCIRKIQGSSNLVM